MDQKNERREKRRPIFFERVERQPKNKHRVRDMNDVIHEVVAQGPYAVDGVIYGETEK